MYFFNNWRHNIHYCKVTINKNILFFYVYRYFKLKNCLCTKFYLILFQRGRFYPQLSYLIKVNTPRAVMQETKKAFKKLPNIESAMTALSNLKGVGTATASALLAAASPESAPFMADECIQAIPEMEGSDYTAKEYLNFVKHIKTVCDRLNKVSFFNFHADPTNSNRTFHSIFVGRVSTHYTLGRT